MKRNVVLLTPRQQIVFDAAAVRMIQHLIGGAVPDPPGTPSNSFMSATSRFDTPQ